ncbi:NRIP1 protein, partial [Atractosteus spatula]|nr:NRIP1 protein [Atractosteus spatula]
MTHGEEPGSEMHQDSAVLTYLEGLLMHQVSGRQSAAATRRSDAGHSERNQNNKTVGSHQLPNHGSNQEDRSVPLGRATQHLKKARLLRSSEAWNGPETQQLPASVVNLNGQNRDLLTGALDSSPKCKAESTLLASLLQSFSSRLQSVALSQQIMQNLKQQDNLQSDKSTQVEDEALRCYGSASSRLKGLLKKNKMQNHNSVPYQRRNSQERFSDSPEASQSSVQPAARDSISCAARLKAVASIVKNRSSPTSSPKPSVACSQLALLLSSEAHLQQYSREQALKAQLSGRSASERLAAMATQQTQDIKQSSMGQHQVSADIVNPLNGQSGTLPQTVDSSKHSPSPIQGQSRVNSSQRSLHSFRDKHSFDRHSSRPSPNCSSLLLHLLNNHNTQKYTNGNSLMEEDYSVFPNHSSPLRSESEYSNLENSLTKDNSDAESSHSSCSPIDLSVKGRASGSGLGSSSSLDKLTETLISNWNPETPSHKITEARESENSSVIKPHHKVTLLQLLLGHKNNEKVNKNSDNPDLQSCTTSKPNCLPTGRVTPSSRFEETRTRNSPDALCFRKLQSLPVFSQEQDTNGSASPYSLSLSPQVQAIPLDLCKAKSHSNENVQESSFSASKLLQNLAQCGLQKSIPSPPIETSVSPGIRQTYEPRTDKPVALLERLNAPLTKNKTPVLEEPLVSSMKLPYVMDPSPSVSEIENLLERRTVLQLLLGATTSKEKASGKRKRPADKGDSLDKHSDPSPGSGNSYEPTLDIKIKTEPRDEVHLSNNNGEEKRGQVEERLNEGNSPHSSNQKDIKSEVLSAEAIPKDGLLSQLLKHPPSTYQVKTQDVCTISGKEGLSLNQGPAVPKKRKLCMGMDETLNTEPCIRAVSAVQRDGSSEPSGSRTSDGRNVHNEVNRLEADSLLQVGCPVSESLPKDGKGFNVLKQLLLSDNCLKDISLPRSATSPSIIQANCKINGNIPSKSGYNHDFTVLQHNSSPQGPVSLDFKPLSAASERSKPPGSPWGYHAARQDSPKLNLIPVKRELEGPIQWVISGEEKQDPSIDSPRLTKSNPILYYMLQKGNSHIGKLRKTEAPECEMQVKVKEEPVSELDAYSHRLRLKQHHHQLSNEKQGNETESFNRTVEKC